jgi:hypothetical protein
VTQHVFLQDWDASKKVLASSSIVCASWLKMELGKYMGTEVIYILLLHYVQKYQKSKKDVFI